MTAPTDEFAQPCPHGGSVVTCNDCLSEYVTTERLMGSLGVCPRPWGGRCGCPDERHTP